VPGNRTGGIKAANKNKELTEVYLNGEYTVIPKSSFYRYVGALGGKKSTGGGFAANPELAREAGRKGGLKSRKNRKAL